MEGAVLGGFAKDTKSVKGVGCERLGEMHRGIQANCQLRSGLTGGPTSLKYS